MTDVRSTDHVSTAPWHTSLTDDCTVVDSRHFDVCEMLGDYETASEEMEANARLIAAAPDLLELAKQYASECSGCDGEGRILVTFNDREAEYDPCEDCADIREIISKAEGK